MFYNISLIAGQFFDMLGEPTHIVSPYGIKAVFCNAPSIRNGLRPAPVVTCGACIDIAF